MKDQPRLQLSIPQLKSFLQASEESGYLFEIVFTGGEPLLWRNFRESLPILRASPAVESLTLFTNAIHISPLDDQSVALIDTIRISEYDNNGDNIKLLKNRWPDKVKVVDRTKFYENPKTPIENSEPADCMNDELMLVGDEIFACPHSQSISLKHNLPGVFSKPVARDFIKGIASIKKGQSHSVCKMCISNSKVRDVVAKVQNNIHDKEVTPESADIKAI